MKQIALVGKLGKGKFVKVDDEDFIFLNQWEWHMTSKGYAYRVIIIAGKRYDVLLHRVVMLVPQGVAEIDHINGDRLDCQKKNLRITDDRGNGRNKGLRSNSISGYKGVSWSKSKKKWQVQLRCGDKTWHLGTYRSAREGAIAYNAKAKEEFGEFARLNVIKPLEECENDDFPVFIPRPTRERKDSNRQKVLEYLKGHMDLSSRQIAIELKLSPGATNNWIKQVRESKVRNKNCEERIRAYMLENPLAGFNKISEALGICRATVYKYRKKILESMKEVAQQK